MENVESWKFLALIIRLLMAPASAITFTSMISRKHTSWALSISKTAPQRLLI